MKRRITHALKMTEELLIRDHLAERLRIHEIRAMLYALGLAVREEIERSGDVGTPRHRSGVHMFNLTWSHPMKNHKISLEEAKQIGATLGVNWDEISLDQFRHGLEVEFEHGSRDPGTDVTGDDVKLTGKIAWAHLKEFPDYYARLDRMEAEAKAYWASHR